MQLSSISLAITRLGRTADADPDAAIKALFANDEEGVWFDPSDLSTMFQDSAGTTPVTAVGQPVGKINDKSGRNNHATQVTAAARPVLRQDANSKYYLEFDGVDDWLSTAEIDFSSTDKVSAFLGFLQPSGSTGVMYELSANTNSNNAFSMLTASPSFIQHNPSGYSVANVSVALGTKCVFSCTYNRALSIDENAVRLNSEIPTITRPNNVDLSGNFGSYPIYIGSRGGSSLRFTGYSYSLIILGRLATGQEIADTEAWVNERTGAF